MRRWSGLAVFLCAVFLCVSVSGALGAALGWPGATASAASPWSWPVSGAIVRGFDPPDDPYGAGHRGIDIAAPVGTTVVAPDDGGGVTSTCSWLTSVLVRKGDRVLRGQPVATTGWGHADLTVPHLHFGVRLNGAYVAPLSYLASPSVVDLIRLAPLGEP